MSETKKPIYRLVLHPQDANFAPESIGLIREVLFDAGFIAKDSANKAAPEQDGERFPVGEQFLQLLTFMGCSPNINLSPQHEGDQDFCHIKLSAPTGVPRFRRHDGNIFARCPECGRRDPDWAVHIERWETDKSANQYHCPHCANDMSLYDLRWRQQAGFARFFIDVFSIFPQEGIPTENLLGRLQKACEQPWIYFFTNN